MADGRVGFIGLGAMGSGLAHILQKLLASSGGLLVHNRTKDKPEVANLLSEGAEWSKSAADLAAQCDVVFCMLIADKALESVFSDYMAGKPKAGSVFIDCSTVFPDLTEKLESEARQCGVSYLSCTIVGRPDATRAGKALLLAGGDPQAKAKVMPLLKSLGRGVVDAGPEARQSNVLKLTTNFFIASMIELIAEGMTLADKNGVSREAVLSVLKESFPGPITTGYAERVAKDAVQMSADQPGFSARGGLKDASHIQHLARASGVPMPVIDIVVRHLTELNERGNPDTLEWGSSALLIREAAGIEDTQKLLKKPEA